MSDEENNNITNNDEENNNDEESFDEDFEFEDNDMDSLLNKYFYDEEQDVNIVNVLFNIQKTLETQNKILKKQLEKM